MAKSISALAVGDKIKLGTFNGKTIIWQIADKNYTGDINGQIQIPENCYLLMSYKQIACIQPGSTNEQGAAQYWLLSAMRQWLNSTALPGEWYSKTFAAQTWIYYESWPGFLNAFTQSELAVMPADNNGDKVIMPWAGMAADPSSNKEYDHLGNVAHTYYFRNMQAAGYANRTVQTMSEVETDAPIAYYPTGHSYHVPGNYLAISGTINNICQSSYYPNVIADYTGPNAMYIRPICYISNTARVSDTADSDGCYTIVYNQAPPAPSTLNVPQTITSGEANTISWSLSVDPDGDAVAYVLERKLGSGDWTRIYNGSNRSYTDNSVAYGTSTVQYRVKAYDIYNEASSYTTSAVRNVTSNRAPVITGVPENLGVVNETGCAFTYKVTDADNDTVTVTVKLDDKVLSSGTVNLNTDYTVSFDHSDWIKVRNGNHHITVTATDGKATVTKTAEFTKRVYEAEFSLNPPAPVAGSNRPEKLSLSLYWHLPENSTGFIQAANNGNDSGGPTYEDCTAAVLAHQAYTFSNTTKTASSWAIAVHCVLFNFATTVKHYHGSSVVDDVTIPDGWIHYLYVAYALASMDTSGTPSDGWDGEKFVLGSSGTPDWESWGLSFNGTWQSGDRVEIAVAFAEDTPYFTMLSGATNSTT